MNDKLISRVVILGGLSIIGILFMQSYWLLKTWDIKDKEFDQTVNIVLKNVADRLANYNNSVLPKTGLIQRKSSNYYAVNINGSIDAGALEDFLLQEVNKQNLNTDFEYAVYDCHNNDLVYGNFCSVESFSPNQKVKKSKLPKFNDLVYYFVVRFPSRESFLLANMRMTIIFSLLSILSISFFIYSIMVILYQKKLSVLQKDFINNMTHEFKTPISSIKIASDVLSQDTYIKENQRLNTYINIIRSQNTRLNDQVEKVLNVARLEKDSIALKKEPLELNKILSEIVNGESLKLKNGYIHFKPLTENVVINADKIHFINVFTNMIDNAVKYAKDIVEIDLECQQNNNNIIISLHDKGIGIDKENQKKLFDKFYRVSTGDVHDVKGFGLGLYYVKNICTAHGWQINVQSEIGKGTSFIIHIPKNKNV